MLAFRNISLRTHLLRRRSIASSPILGLPSEDYKFCEYIFCNFYVRGKYLPVIYSCFVYHYTEMPLIHDSLRTCFNDLLELSF